MNSDAQDAARVRIPPPLVFLGGVLAGALLQRAGFPFHLSLSTVPRVVLASALAALGIVPLALSSLHFSRTGQDPKPWKSTPEIISTGVYAWTRNPMYIGMALIQAAIGVALTNGWILVLVPVAMAGVYWTAIRPEEAYLERKFGRAFLDYKGSVRRWL